MKSMTGRVSKSGRIHLPAEYRKAVGLDRGGDVVVELDGQDIRIRTVDEVISRSIALTRRLLSDNPSATIDAFIADRRRCAVEK